MMCVEIIDDNDDAYAIIISVVIITLNVILLLIILALALGNYRNRMLIFISQYGRKLGISKNFIKKCEKILKN